MWICLICYFGFGCFCGLSCCVVPGRDCVVSLLYCDFVVITVWVYFLVAASFLDFG